MPEREIDPSGNNEGSVGHPGTDPCERERVRVMGVKNSSWTPAEL
jgi:hypothetical protein